VAEATRVDGQRLAQAELHAEVRDAAERGLRVSALEPGRSGEARAALPDDRFETRPEGGIAQRLLQACPGDRLQHDPGIVGECPQLPIELAPQLVAGVLPRGAQVERQLDELLDARHVGMGPVGCERSVHVRRQPSTAVKASRRIASASSWMPRRCSGPRKLSAYTLLTFSVPDGRAANQPCSARTLMPPMGEPLPGAAAITVRMGSPAR